MQPLTLPYRLGIAFVAGSLLSGACTRSGVQPPADAELEIRVVRGPINPVEREGEPNSVAVAHALVTIQRLPSGRAARAETDAAGIARVSVASGDYAIEVSRCPEGTMFAKGVQVTVEPGATNAATLTCDTGIR